MDALRHDVDQDALLDQIDEALDRLYGLATLIRTAAAEIGDTSYQFEDDMLRALDNGAAIREAAEVMREKAQGAREGLTEVIRAREKAVAA